MENDTLCWFFQWIKDAENQRLIISNLILPIAIGILAFIASSLLTSWRERRRKSLLGAALCESLIEEIGHGIKIMGGTKQMLEGGEYKIIGKLPRGSWSGMQTISDDVLERLLCLSKGKNNRGFPIREIRIHLKNYFEHIAVNWDQVAESMKEGLNWQKSAHFFLDKGDYLKAAKGVLEMTEDARIMLHNNSKKWIPNRPG